MVAIVPQLLISVRDAEEAAIASQGGADIVDVKEPENGSLGRASSTVIESIAKRLASQPPNQRPPLSLALGELSEWRCESSVNTAASGPGFRHAVVDDVSQAIAAASPAFVKLGLANAVSFGESWASVWASTMSHCDATLSAHHTPQWVAVAYADADRSAAPSVIEVLDAAVQHQCAVLLIDTFRKDGTNLLSWLTLEQLAQLRHQTALRGIKLALAGKVTEADLSCLRPLCPDIIAVRGAVCTNGDRKAKVDVRKIQAFRNAMLRE